MQESGTDDHHRAYVALRGVLRALRDRLSIEESAHLSSNLPLLIRGIFFDGWDRSKQPVKMRRDEFLAAVGESFVRDGVDTERATRAVFKVLSEHVEKGEINIVKQTLPKDLRELWPAASHEGAGV